MTHLAGCVARGMASGLTTLVLLPLLVLLVYTSSNNETGQNLVPQ